MNVDLAIFTSIAALPLNLDSQAAIKQFGQTGCNEFFSRIAGGAVTLNSSTGIVECFGEAVGTSQTPIFPISIGPNKRDREKGLLPCRSLPRNEPQAATNRRNRSSTTKLPDGVDKAKKTVTVQEAASDLGKSDDWVRRRFRKISGTICTPSPKKRGKRPYCTMTIPLAVYEAAKGSWTIR